MTEELASPVFFFREEICPLFEKYAKERAIKCSYRRWTEKGQFGRLYAVFLTNDMVNEFSNQIHEHIEPFCSDEPWSRTSRLSRLLDELLREYGGFGSGKTRIPLIVATANADRSDCRSK